MPAMTKTASRTEPTSQDGAERQARKLRNAMKQAIVTLARNAKARECAP